MYKDIPNYPNYQINYDGFVYNKITGRLLKQTPRNKHLEYKGVCLYKKGKKTTFNIHTLMKMTFYGI